MSIEFDSSLFIDIADAIGLGNPAIVEKDYYVVQLLRLVSTLDLEHHQLVFSGGTALAKSAIKTYRMSEDIDLKLIPKQSFSELSSRNAKKKVRKSLKQLVESVIKESTMFSIEEEPTIRDEYRYFSFLVRYPQEYEQAPCLKPFIKLEFIESALLSNPESRSIKSIYAEMVNKEEEVSEIACSAIIDTQAEKLLSIMRRVASVARNVERDDDPMLIRHVYDTYCIQQEQVSNLKEITPLVKKAIDEDVSRYGKQHPQMVESPLDELLFGLALLKNEEKFSNRYNDYVSPMVYAKSPVSWEDALTVFDKLACDVLDGLKEEFKSPR